MGGIDGSYSEEVHLLLQAGYKRVQLLNTVSCKFISSGLFSNQILLFIYILKGNQFGQKSREE